MADLGELDGRVLIFGGPYSNLAATAAMRARARELGIGAAQAICSGDLVAYCGEPRQTLDLVRDWGIPVVMGNCEEALAFDEPDCGCGFEPGSSCSALAAKWFRYARQQVTAEQRAWMQSLPRSLDFSIGGKSVRVLHGDLDSINRFVFASSDAAAKRAQLERAGVDVIVGGHCGIPFGQRFGERLWLNAGVIGMPANDGGCHGWYLLISDTGAALDISWHRLDYDYAASRQSTLAAGMREYGEALADGLWPSMDVLPAQERGQRGQPLELPAIRL